MKKIIKYLAYTYAYAWVHSHPEYFQKGNTEEGFKKALEEFGFEFRDQMVNVIKDLMDEMKQ